MIRKEKFTMNMYSNVIRVNTNSLLEFLDITPLLESEIEKTGVRDGFLLIRSRHTTAAITCTESDPDVHQDCREILDDMMPVDRPYHHIYEGKMNARAHQAEMLGFGHATWAAIRSGNIDLGNWQRIYLVELFRPMTRRIDCLIVGG